MMAKLFALTLLYFAATAWAYPTGAPESACDDMTPRHDEALPQSAPFPYKITLDKDQVQQGEDVKITISGQLFKGLLLQVRDGDKAIGSFQIAENDNKFRTIDCHGTTGSAVTHSNPSEETDATLVWKAPQTTGKYTLYATVAKDKDTFWVAQPSGTITGGSLGTLSMDCEKAVTGKGLQICQCTEVHGGRTAEIFSRWRHFWLYRK